MTGISNLFIEEFSPPPLPSPSDLFSSVITAPYRHYRLHNHQLWPYVSASEWTQQDSVVNFVDSKTESLFQLCLQGTCQSSTAAPFSRSHTGTCTQGGHLHQLLWFWKILENSRCICFWQIVLCQCFSKAPVCQIGYTGMQGHWNLRHRIWTAAQPALCNAGLCSRTHWQHSQ